jgi:predicted DNA-binding antitoxin AbrB/MazE fold protein
MAMTIQATYENGVLKPAQSLPLREQEQVQITIHSTTDWVERTAGIIPWAGDAETLQRFAEDPELDLEESPCPLPILSLAKRTHRAEISSPAEEQPSLSLSKPSMKMAA